MPAVEASVADGDARPVIIAGPCLLESRAVVDAVAAVMAGLAAEHGQRARFVFKGSFDKANRTSVESPRGPGLETGLAMLQAVRDRHGLPVLTDVHETAQVARAGEACDVLQIPAFLARQTDLLAAAARTGCIVNVKKGQFMAPGDMAHVVAKLQHYGAREIWLTERGTTFGYHNLVVDMRSFPLMAATGMRAIIDATHSVQLPSGAGGQSGGQREFIPTLMRAALAAGARGLFVEAHPDPDRALSDAGSQLPLDQLPALVADALALWDHLASRPADSVATPPAPVAPLSTPARPRIRFLVCDVDGVLTDGRVLYDSDGGQLKAFDIKDGMGIAEAVKAGLEIAFLSHGSQQKLVETRAARLGVKTVYVGTEPKRDILDRWRQERGLDWAEVAYIGDDINDIPCVEAAGLGVCPADAVPAVRAVADLVLTLPGGRGALRELLDQHLRPHDERT